jgi:Cys-rich four helix bundle protein (predicted Tat secretion target)
MDRRSFIAAGAAAVAAVATRAAAEDDPHAEHKRQAAAKAAQAGKGGPPWVANAALVEAAADCGRAGRVCLEHCLSVLRAGDTSMARCSQTVSAMLPLCAALEALATQGSPHLKALAAVCAKACRDCEAACKEHAGHHEACKRCMETCGRCAAACEKAA